MLVRQGVAAWMHLCEADLERVDRHCGQPHTKPEAALPAPVRSALLAVLTNLVFETHGQEQSV